MAYDTTNPFVVADAAPSDRAAFYRRTYAHLAGAIAVWGVLLAVYFTSGIAIGMAKMIFGAGMFGILAVMLGLGFLASFGQKLAFTGTNKGAQYSGLGLAVLAESVIFVPLIVLVIAKFDQSGAPFSESLRQVFMPAFITTGLLFGGLTASVFMTKTDFSFLRTAVTIGLFASLGVIICAMIFGISLGFWFSLIMVVLMAGCILWETSELKYRVSPDQYVGAATMLFISFMTMLWYVIRMFMSRRD